MKNYMSIALLALALVSSNPSQGAYKLRSAQTHSIAALTSSTEEATMLTSNLSESTSALMAGSQAAELPRGRGNGIAATKSFLFGWFSIFPFLGVPFAVLAYWKGIPNVGRIRKNRGFAIAGIILATLGLALTVAILTAV